MAIEELLERGKHMIRTAIASGDEVIPLIFIEVEPSSVIVMEFKAQDQKDEDLKKDLVNRFIFLARALAKFKGAMIVAEAWLSRDAQYAEAGKKPSMDPKAQDSAICVAYEANEKRMVTAPIFEKGNKRHIGEFTEFPISQATTSQFWTDPGFQEFKPLPLDVYMAAGIVYDRLFEVLTKQSTVGKN